MQHDAHKAIFLGVLINQQCTLLISPLSGRKRNFPKGGGHKTGTEKWSRSISLHPLHPVLKPLALGGMVWLGFGHSAQWNWWSTDRL